MLKYLLLGRTGSGREFFQKLLEKNGLVVAKSYTTREQRDENDTMHHFIDISQLNSYNRLFETTHDDVTYFYTEDEIIKADIIPIDPENINAICVAYSDTAFRLIKITASKEDRVKHAVANADDKLIAETDFLAVCEEEDEAFCEFEEKMITMSLKIDNILLGHMIDNDFTDSSDIYEWPAKIVKSKRVFEKMLQIIDELRKADVLIYNDETNEYTLFVEDKDTKNSTALQLSPDRMTEQIIIDPDGMFYVMTAWLELERTI